MKAVVLGGSGMLGAMVVGCLAADDASAVSATVQSDEARATLESRFPRVGLSRLDARTASPDQIARVLEGAAWAINAIGIIKPHIRDDNAAEVERAIDVNSIFPHRLARAAEQTGTRVIQIATDCVYSGGRGEYVETDEHDARDVYGKSKSLGEVRSPAVHHLRCSIIGPELKHHVSLLDWFRGQAQGATVNGFVNHRWNGVSTLHFGRLCRGIISSGVTLPHLVHVLPGDVVTKADLLAELAAAYGRHDVTIRRVDAQTVIDRTLTPRQPELNAALWAAAGYATPPAIGAMVRELAAAHREWPGRRP